MGIRWDRSNSIERDNNDARAIGALAYFFIGGTSTPYTVYQDAEETTPHEHPVEADGNGRWPAVFIPFGTFKETVTTAGGTELWSDDNIPNPEPFDETFELDETAIYNTGDYIFVGKNGARSGAVRCSGKTIGNAASGATERAHEDTEELFSYRWNNYADAQAAVSGGRGASAAADFAANKTITLPDHRNAGLIGFGDMGNTDAGLAASAPVVSGSPILAGSIIGANTHTLVSSELAAHTHSFSATTGSAGAHSHTYSGSTNTTGAHTHGGTTGTENQTHTHTINISGNANVANGVDRTVPLISAAAQSGNASVTHTHTYTTSSDGDHSHTYSGTTSSASDHTHSVSGTSGSTGSDGAHNNLSRAIPVTVLMKL